MLTVCSRVCVSCLSVVQVELAKQKEEHNQTHVLQQEVMREAATSQNQLKSMTSSQFIKYKYDYLVFIKRLHATGSN